MSRLKIALLAEEAANNDPISDEEVAQQQAQAEATAAQAESIQALDVVADGAEAVADRLEKAPVGEAGEAAESVAEAALEAFRLLAMVEGHRRPGMNSAGSARQHLSSELRHVSDVTRRGLKVAREGFFGDMFYNIRKAFTSQDRLMARMSQADAAFDQRGSNGALMTDKTYSSWFNPNNKTVVSGEDVSETLKMLMGKFRSKDLLASLNEISQVVGLVTQSTSGWFANDKDRQRIEEAADQISRIQRNFIREALVPRKMGHNCAIKACTEDDHKAIQKLNLSSMEGTEMVVVMDHLCKTIDEFYSRSDYNIPLGDQNFRISKSQTADYVVSVAFECVNTIGTMYSHLFNLVYAYTAWLEDSTNK